ncbi:MAG: hypothetical protein HEQ32_08960 [Vampirovibrio sp.]
MEPTNIQFSISSQPNSTPPKRKTALDTVETIAKVEEEDIKLLLELIRSVYVQTGEAPPSEDVLRSQLPETITHVEYINLRTEVQKAADLKQLGRILKNRTQAYAEEVQDAFQKKLKAPVQTLQSFLKAYNIEFSALLANTTASSEFIRANSLQRSQILAKAVAYWAKEKGLSAVNIEAILNEILPESGAKYLQNIAKAGIQDASTPLGFTPAMVRALQSLVPRLITEEKPLNPLTRLQEGLGSALTGYLHEQLVEPTTLSPTLKTMAKTQIAKGIQDTGQDPDAIIQQAKTAAQDDLWKSGIKAGQVGPTLAKTLEPVKKALQADPTTLDELGAPMQASVSNALAAPFKNKRDTSFPPKVSPFHAFMTRTIEIALSPNPSQDDNAPIRAFEDAVRQLEASYLQEKGYSPNAQSYIQGMLAELKSSEFWSKTPEARASRVQELSRQFLKNYMNPRMTRRELFKKFCLPESDPLISESKPLISKPVGNTKLKRRAIVPFLGLQKVFEYLGKTSKSISH